MSKINYKNNHLVSNIENTEENRNYIKDINKLARKSESRYRLKIRYRKPIKGEKYGWGGSLQRKKATAFSIYIDDKTPWQESQSHRLWTKISKLEEENDKLRKELLFYKNPYFQWSEDEIQMEIQDIKENIFCRFLDRDKLGCDAWVNAEKLIEKYDQLVEVLNYEREDD